MGGDHPKSAVRTWLRFARAEQGLATTEYGVMLSLIVLASVVAISALGQKFEVLYTLITEAVDQTMS